MKLTFMGAGSTIFARRVIKNFGYYCTESSEHNAEYNPFYIKRNYPELIEKYNIPLDEYPRCCVKQIEDWKKECAEMVEDGVKDHEMSHEYAARTRKKEHIYQAAMMDTHTAAELDIDSIKKMVDELIDAHGDYLPKFN